jgi:hypothetical protein
LGKTALESLLKKEFYISHLPAPCQTISEGCITCTKNNAKSVPRPPPGVQRMGTAPFEDLKVDFPEISLARGYKYLLVMVCTYSGWVKAFLSRTEQSWEVAKALLWEVIPWFGLPLTIHSDNGPAFVAEVTQTLTQALGISWKLHAAYWPQNSGKVEQMNHTLKGALAKFSQETHLLWLDLLP